jgi:error-prone DNA polymerase
MPRRDPTSGFSTGSSDDSRYAELEVTSHFSFLRGASSCEELFAQAALLGIPALAVVDRNSLAGIVRAH